MNTKLVNTAAGVINAALTQNRTAAGIALALDSAQLLLTPEKVSEVKRLEARVAELESQLEALRAQGRVLKARPVPSVEGEFHSFLDHAYKTPHDLPPVGGA